MMITIPEPCGEKWSEMKKVDSCSRRCAACDRVLTDFVYMSDDELMLFFKQAQARLNDEVGQGKICGRFRSDQLNRPLNPLPYKTTKANWWKAALLLPFTLFSKSGSSQQLSSDSTPTVQVPFMSPSNDSLVVDWGHGVTPDTTIKWNWVDNEERPWGPITVTGGVPFVITGWTVSCTTFTIPDSLFVVDTIPYAEAHLGVQAAAAPAPKKIPAKPGPAGFAINLGDVVHKEE